MLCQACGFALAYAKHDARAIQEWLRRCNIQHTIRYTEHTLHLFPDFWQGQE
jgi:hypothetical protein